VDDRVVVLLRDDGWKELLLVNGRDVGSNLPIVVDVRDFGQAGDPLALQAAIDAVSGTGAVLSSPAAVYEALSPITLGSGYTFAAHGVIIRRGWARQRNLRPEVHRRAGSPEGHKLVHA